MNGLGFKLFLNSLFPKLYEIEETIEEDSMEVEYHEDEPLDVQTPYILWRVYRTNADVMIKFRRVYTHKGKEIGSKKEKATVPYISAYAQPIWLAPTGDTTIFIETLTMPVFKWKSQMYDASKIGYADYVSMPLKKGKVLENVKHPADLLAEYYGWLRKLKESSGDIMANAKC